MKRHNNPNVVSVTVNGTEQSKIELIKNRDKKKVPIRIDSKTMILVSREKLNNKGRFSKQKEAEYIESYLERLEEGNKRAITY
jgi:hypothetical protein